MVGLISYSGVAPTVSGRWFEPCWQRVNRAAAGQVTGLSKQDAEELLDWLEANDFHHRELSHEVDGYVVKYY